MDNTILRNNWFHDVITTENEVDQKILDKYSKYFDKVNDISKISLKENTVSNSHKEVEIEDFDNLEELVSFSFPYRRLKRTIINTYAKKITKLSGFVTDIREDNFEAKMIDNEKPGTYEIGEFDLLDIDEGDMEMLCIGAVFYWNFGYYVLNGQVKKLSEIRFQRIANIEVDEFQDIYDESTRQNNVINWD